MSIGTLTPLSQFEFSRTYTFCIEAGSCSGLLEFKCPKEELNVLSRVLYFFSLTVKGFSR